MHTSRPVEVEGRFLGVAVAQNPNHRGLTWRFIATDPVVADLDGAMLHDPAEAQRIAGLLLERESGRPHPAGRE